MFLKKLHKQLNTKRLTISLLLAILFICGIGITYKSELFSYFNKLTTFKTSDHYISIIEKFENNFPSFKKQITLDVQKPAIDPQSLSVEYQNVLKRQMAFDGIRTILFINNYRFLANFQFPKDNGIILGTALVEYSQKTNKFTLLKLFNTAGFYLDYPDLQSTLIEYGDKNFSPITYIGKETAQLYQGRSNKNKERWVRVDFNPMMSGLNEEKPEENTVYFGLYKFRPSLFFTNSYIRKKHNLLPNQGMVKLIDLPTSETVNFKDLKNQHFTIGYPDDPPIIEIPSAKRSAHSISLTLRIPTPIGKDSTRIGLLDRHFTVNTNSFFSSQGAPIWVYGEDGQIKLFEE